MIVAIFCGTSRSRRRIVLIRINAAATVPAMGNIVKVKVCACAASSTQLRSGPVLVA